MQISLKNLQTREDPYQLSLDSITNEETKRKYVSWLYRFLSTTRDGLVAKGPTCSGIGQQKNKGPKADVPLRWCQTLYTIHLPGAIKFSFKICKILFVNFVKNWRFELNVWYSVRVSNYFTRSNA